MASVTAESADGPPRFTLDAYSGGVMFPLLANVGWEGPVVVNISGISAGDAIPVHRQHDCNRPVGHASVELGSRIRCQGVFSVDNADSREIHQSAKHKFPWRASIGLSNMRYEIVEPGATCTANGQQFDGPILHVISADLDEVSFVTIPGDKNTEPAIAANQPSGVNAMNFSQWLKSHGWDEATLTDAQKSQLRSMFDSETAAQASADQTDADTSSVSDATDVADDDAADSTDDGTPAAAAVTDVGDLAGATAARGGARLQANRRRTEIDPNIQRIREREAAEEERIAGIREIGSTIGNPEVPDAGGARLTAHAIAQGWSVNQTALYATRNSRPRAAAVHPTSPAQRGSLEALQAGILLRAGRPIDTVMQQHHSIPAWMSRPVNDPARQRIMDSAQEFRDMTMIEYTARGLQAMGHTVPSGYGQSGRLATLQAGFSTGATAAIFVQSIGSMAIAAYNEAGDFSRGWTSETDVPNLLSAERVRMQAAPDLTLQPTGGEAEHAHRDAKSETVRADRYSRTAEVDENDFINDRFQLLRDIPNDFGRAAARLRPTMTAAVLLANAALKDSIALFHTSHNNAITGSPLSQPNLQKARSAISKQKDGEASLNLAATHLLVPSDLGDLAIQLTASAIITNDSGAGGTNPIRMRNILPVEEARLSNGVTDPLTGNALAGSLTTWYLVSAEGHTIEIQFLEGTGRVPQVTVEQLTGGKFGLSITVKHFIGAKALDYRAMQRIVAT